MTLDVAVHSDQKADKKWSLHKYNFLAGNRKTFSTRLSFGRLDKHSNAKRSQTSAGGESDSLNIFFKN